MPLLSELWLWDSGVNLHLSIEGSKSSRPENPRDGYLSKQALLRQAVNAPK